jgi:hypothetical protein
MRRARVRSTVRAGIMRREGLKEDEKNVKMVGDVKMRTVRLMVRERRAERTMGMLFDLDCEGWICRGYAKMMG